MCLYFKIYDQRQFNKIKTKLHEILLINLKKKSQEAEKKRKKEASSRSAVCDALFN